MVILTLVYRYRRIAAARAGDAGADVSGMIVAELGGDAHISLLPLIYQLLRAEAKAYAVCV